MTHCTSSYLAYQWFLGCLNIILLIIGFLFTFKFFSNTNKNKKSLPKPVYNLTIVFIAISIGVLISFIVKSLAECYVSEHVHSRMNNVWSILYVLQWFLLLLILFFRLHSIFNNTAYSLGKCVIITYSIMFTLMFIVFVTGLVAGVVIDDEDLFTICVVLVYIIALSISLGITFLFSLKIYKIYKSGNPSAADSNNSATSTKFISVLARNSVLAFISIGSSITTTIIYIAVYIPLQESQILVADGIINFCYLLDMTSNFLCIMLAFTENNNIYYAICGRVDNYTQSLVSRESKVGSVIEPETINDSTRNDLSSVKDNASSADQQI